MPYSEAQKKWERENTVIINAKLTRNADADILQWLDGKPKATMIKLALREFIANHSDKIPGLERYYVMMSGSETTYSEPFKSFQEACKEASANWKKLTKREQRKVNYFIVRWDDGFNPNEGKYKAPNWSTRFDTIRVKKALVREFYGDTDPDDIEWMQEDGFCLSDVMDFYTGDEETFCKNFEEV